ncbi:TetR/AcrR family transcriptional regulator [Alkalibacillus silvisoli]|uniref:TetR/AcrR family transcriptional regulator n=1 Tax=Alkalibacillus silvisoli TaxID=392823 RepID=A0ABP3K113_9BACI
MSKQDKRKLLIDAAYNVFVKKGYLNASIKDIANEANITTGLVHYYFKNKEELLLSVQQEVQTYYQRKYDGHPGDSVSLEEVLHEIKTRAERNPDWYRWRYEIYSLGIKDKGGHLEKQVESILKDGRKSLSEPMQHIVGNSQDAYALSSILLACFDGLALQKIVDDQFDIDQPYRLLTELLELYINKSDSD